MITIIDFQPRRQTMSRAMAKAERPPRPIDTDATMVSANGGSYEEFMAAILASVWEWVCVVRCYEGDKAYL